MNFRVYFIVIVFVSCSKNKEISTIQQPLKQKVNIENKPYFSKVPMQFINEGSYVPLYGSSTEKVKISSFKMDIYPVTNVEFQNFLKAKPQWQKSKIKNIYADENYLNDWKNDTLWNENSKPNAPITNISWFVANAYCACQGKRLPTVDEWEYVAMADETHKDARKIKSFTEKILTNYEKPKTYLTEIGKSTKNYWGIYDLHGLVWEWNADFNSVLITGESRNDFETDKQLFCGSESLNTTDLMNYTAFIRYAFRGSLKAQFGVKNLGFRCVKDTIIKN